MNKVGNAGRSNATLANSLPGIPGTGVDDLIDGYAAGVDANATSHVLMNWGVNDMGPGLPNQATWEADYGTIISYCATRFPNATMVLSYPWRAGYDASSATMHGWVDNVIAWCGTQSIPCVAGADEAIVLKGADNGATNTIDGVHLSFAGAEDYAAATGAAMGW
jgi:hypothetical protein